MTITIDDIIELRYYEGMERKVIDKIGQRIEELMKKRGFLQKELAEAIDIDPASLSRIISGDKKPSAEMLANLATALRVTSDYLLGIEKEEDLDIDKGIRVLARNKEMLTSEDKKEIIELLVGL